MDGMMLGCFLHMECWKLGFLKGPTVLEGVWTNG